MTDQAIIQGCKQDDSKAQRAFYDRFAPKMFGVCKRYIKGKEDAEDLLIEGLFKAIDKIHTYHGEGSFEGWVRRIMVNECLMFLRKKHPLKLSIEVHPTDAPTKVSIEDDLAAQDILKLLDQLPIGYRTIFNLYVIEGYKHREIAEELGISINTSKSQLILAKKKLQILLEKQKYPGIFRFKKKAVSNW